MLSERQARAAARDELNKAKKVEKYMVALYEQKFSLLMNTYTDLMKPYWRNGKFDVNSYTKDKLYNRNFIQKTNHLETELVLAATMLSAAANKIITAMLADNYLTNITLVAESLGSPAPLQLKIKSNVLARISQPYTPDMNTFSHRIWHNHELLSRNLQSVISKGVREGASIPNMTRELQGLMDSGYNNTRRIIRTETMAVHTKAHLDTYSALGVTHIKVLESQAHDEACSPFNNKIIPIEQVKIGYNAPPFHPFAVAPLPLS